MNEAQLDDLEQFMAETVSPTEKKLETKMTVIQSEVAELRHETADGFAGVGEAIAHR